MGKKKRRRSHRRTQPRRTTRKMSGATIAGIGLLALVFLIIFTGDTPRRMEAKGNPSERPDAPPAYGFQKQGELRFISAKQGPTTTIDIEIAGKEWKRNLGLMYREKMAETQGMLFVFEEERPRAFWMKNTIISLDMLFVNAKREIVTICKTTTPYSEELYTSNIPAKYVVEVNAGFCDRQGIVVGDRISWSTF